MSGGGFELQVGQIPEITSNNNRVVQEEVVIAVLDKILQNMSLDKFN